MGIDDIIHSYDPNKPLEQASTIPSSWYIDPELAEMERRRVFSRCWHPVARVEQVEEPGSYVTFAIAGEPGVLVRGTDRVLRALSNVCRHHAAEVMTEAQGKADQLRCPYHGWTYSLDGTLKAAPEMSGVCDFDRMAIRLPSMHVSTWRRWAWVSLDAGTLPFDESFPDLHLEHLHWVERRSYRLECNWKVFVDNYLDGGYHVPLLHKQLGRVLSYSEYQIELGDRWCLQWSPLDGGGRALYYWIYPNFMINLYPDAMDTNLVIPIGPRQTEVIFDFYFARSSFTAARYRACASPTAPTYQERIRASEEIQQEDTAICESVQRGLASSTYEAGRLSVHREAGEHLFHRLLYSDLTDR